MEVWREDLILILMMMNEMVTAFYICCTWLTNIFLDLKVIKFLLFILQFGTQIYQTHEQSFGVNTVDTDWLRVGQG